MEFLNVILVRQKLKLRFVNDCKPTALYIINIYCGNCGYVCKLKGNEKCTLEFDTIISNNIDHLGPDRNDLFNF